MPETRSSLLAEARQIAQVRGALWLRRILAAYRVGRLDALPVARLRELVAASAYPLDL